MEQHHKDNLLKLANHLEALPANYDQFDMEYFMKDRYAELYPFSADRLTTDCGTVACAVGHGPAAGIPIEGDTGWDKYAERVFGIGAVRGSYDRWEYLFSGAWAGIDNTPKGAAARIKTFLKLGRVPEGFSFDDGVLS